MTGEAPNQPGRWESPLFPLPANGTNLAVVATHGRGHVPRQMRWVLVSTATGELGFLPGDELEVVGGNNSTNPTCWANATQVGLAMNAATWNWSFTQKTGASTANLTFMTTRWALKCYCDW